MSRYRLRPQEMGQIDLTPPSVFTDLISTRTYLYVFANIAYSRCVALYGIGTVIF